MYTGSTDIHYFEGLAWLRGDAAHDEFVEKLYEDTIDLHRFFDFDILYLPWRIGGRPAKQIDEHSLLYGDCNGSNWQICRFDPGSRTFGVAEKPSATCDDVVRSIRSALKDTDKAKPVVELSPLLVRAIKEYGNEFVVAGNAGMAIPMETGWLEATALEPELVAEWLDMRVEWALASIETQKKAGIWLINGGGDFAFNSGPVYSPAFFENVMAPRWKRIFDRCRELGVYYIMRSDGNLWPIADALFGRAKPHAYYECDYDAGMRFDELRRCFSDLVLFGNVSCNLLLKGTPEEVSEKVIECLEAAAPRFVGSSANAILHGTPPANVFALYDTVKK